MRVLADVLVQRVHVGPALLLAHHLQPRAHVEVAGARRCRVRHDDLAGIHGLGQVGPRRRLRQILLLCFDGVEADGGAPGIHAHPCRRVGLVAVSRTDLRQIGRCVRRQHAFLVQDGQARCGQAPHHVGTRVVLLGQQLGGDDAGGVAHPLDFDVRIGLLEGVLVRLHLVSFQRRVHGQRGLGERRRGKRHRCRRDCGGQQGKTCGHGFLGVV